MKHTFTVQLSINTEDIVNLLAFESGGFDYWAMISTEDDAYEAASRRLTKRLKNKHEMICYEDIYFTICGFHKFFRLYTAVPLIF